MRQLLFLLLSACLCARAAPPLTVPHGRVGEPVAGEGLSAAWRPAGAPPFVLRTRFDIPAASGTLLRYAVVVSPAGGVSEAQAPDWDAAQLLTGSSGRRIYTINERGQTVPFSWDALDAGWRNWLDVAQFEGAPDGLGEPRLVFLRGERAMEGKQFRQRGALLGDALHSVPLIVGPPSAFEQSAAYAAFRARFQARPVVAYLGTNDGMLHAFDAGSGAELFAYVPRVLGAQLSALTGPGYVPRPYVDGSAGQGDAVVGGQWRTVLASGMGMGARGLFALDVTEPGQFGGALWEFTERDDPAIGYVRAAPLVTRVRTGTLRQQVQYGHVVVASSGINPLGGAGDGALFVLDVGKPAAQPWQAGVNYFRIATAGADPALANALGPPALAIRPDASAGLAYAGDLQGNLWRFDLRARQAVKVFTAQDRDGLAQPIEHAPAVVFAPGGGYLVLFATGRLLEQADLLKASFTPQSMYAILDRPELATLPPATRKQLLRRTVAGKGSVTIKGALFDYAAKEAKRGWYFDFPDAAEGERSAGSPVPLAGAIVFDTVLPGSGVPPARRSYLIDALTGFALDSAGVASPGAATGTLLPAGTPAPLLVASGVDAGARDPTGGVTVIHSFTLLRPGAGPGTVMRVRRLAGRLAWREVANWQELHGRTKEKK